MKIGTLIVFRIFPLKPPPPRIFPCIMMTEKQTVLERFERKAFEMRFPIRKEPKLTQYEMLENINK
jgi:hypothetical protein